MGDLSKAIYNIRKIDELGKEDTIIHKINPMIKIIVTLAYVIKVISIKEFLFADIIVILAYSIFIFIANIFKIHYSNLYLYLFLLRYQ